MIKQLTNVWKTYTPKKIAIIFKKYAISKGLKPYRYTLKDYSNTYIASSSCGGSNWNRVSCYYLADNARFGDENLIITLRKKAGDYFIVERKKKRAFEVDYRGLQHWEPELMQEIYRDHKELFDTLFATNK